VAGAAAARQGAHREAAAHYGAAAAYASRLPEPEYAGLLEAYAMEAYLTGLNEEALQAREAALHVRDGLGQPERVGENLRWISRLSWWTGRVAHARETAARAVSVLEAAPESEQLAMAYSNQAQLHLTTHELDDAVRWAQRALSLAERLGDQGTAIHASITLGTAWLVRDDPRGRPALEEAYARAAARGLIDHAARAMHNLFLVTADELALFDAAVPLADQSLAYTRQHDLDGMHDMVRGARAKLRLERGDWAGALADADATLDRSGPVGVNAVLPLVARGRIQAARGHGDALATLDQAARAAEGVGDVPMVTPVADARSEYFLWSGNAERARAEARRGLDFAGAEHALPFIAGRLAWRLWRAGGDDPVPELAAEPFRLMIEGDWAAAAAEWERRGATYLQAEALAAGDEAAAGKALRILDGLGATRAAEFQRAEMRKRGISRVPRGPRRTTVANSAGLTPRQVDVLALLVDGLSNAEIATRLTLSTKTVDHHVQAVLRKLGVASRGQAAAEAHRLNLVP
jgi:DNA-binding CsgD family transcriptional regulator/tetratricopeptide (TPR) repeat protein